MKKTLFIARPAKKYTAVILTSLILLVGVADVKAQANDYKKEVSGITYLGSANDLMTFNINFKNPQGEKVTLHLTNDLGEVIFHKVFDTNFVNTNLLLKSTGDKCRVTFTVRSGKEVINQKFDIEPVTKVVSETVVSRM